MFCFVRNSMMMRRNATIAAVLLSTMMMMMMYVAANTVEIGNDGEASNVDEPTTTQNIIKILYCTS